MVKHVSWYALAAGFFFASTHVLARIGSPVWPEFRYGLNSDGRSQRAGPRGPQSFFVSATVRGITWISGLVVDEVGVYGVTESDRFFALSTAGVVHLRCNVSLNVGSRSTPANISTCRQRSAGILYSTRRMQPPLVLLGDHLAVVIASQGQLVLVNTATCEVEWSSRTGLYNPCISPTLNHDLALYVVGGNRSSVHALKLSSDNSSLEVVWREDLVPIGHASTSVTVANDSETLYIVSAEGRLASISVVNDTRSSTELGLAACTPAVSASPAVWVCTEGALYYPIMSNTPYMYNCSHSNVGLLYIPCQTGVIAVNRLNYEARQDQAWMSVFDKCTVSSSLAVLQVNDSVMVVIGCTQSANGTSHAVLIALDGLTGTVLWQLTLPGSGVVASPNADANSVVFVSTYSPAHVCAVDGTSGMLLWSQSVPGEIVPSPIIGMDSGLLMFVPGCGFVSSLIAFGGDNTTCVTSPSGNSSETTSTPSSATGTPDNPTHKTTGTTPPHSNEEGYSSKILAAIIVSSLVGAALLITAIFCAFIKYQERQRRGRYVYSSVQDDDDVWNTS